MLLAVDPEKQKAQNISFMDYFQFQRTVNRPLSATFNIYLTTIISHRKLSMHNTTIQLESIRTTGHFCTELYRSKWVKQPTLQTVILRCSLSHPYSIFWRQTWNKQDCTCCIHLYSTKTISF